MIINIINNIFIFIIGYLTAMGLTYALSMAVIHIINKVKRKGAIYV